MQAIVFLFLLWRLSPGASQMPERLVPSEEKSVEYLLSASMDVLQHTQLELWKLYLQRQSLRGNGPYEIGFLVRTTEERYRKMVDLYDTSILMSTNGTLRTREHIMHLQAIEKLHWDIMHLANMLHEVERKYKIRPQQLDKRIFYPFGVTPTTTTTTTTTAKTTTKKGETTTTTTGETTTTTTGETTTTTTGETTTKTGGGRGGHGHRGW